MALESFRLVVAIHRLQPVIPWILGRPLFCVAAIQCLSISAQLPPGDACLSIHLILHGNWQFQSHPPRTQSHSLFLAHIHSRIVTLEQRGIHALRL